jgi:hypothetical protein
MILRVQLGVYRGSTGLQAMINGNLKKIAERDEQLVVSSGIPYTIIRTASLQNMPGCQQGFNFKEVLEHFCFIFNFISFKNK